MQCHAFALTFDILVCPNSKSQGYISTLYTTFRVLYSPLYQAAMQAYLLSTIEEKSWTQMNKYTLFLV